MSRKLFIIIIAIIVLGGLAYGYVTTRTPAIDTGIETTKKGGIGSLFPFLGGNNDNEPAENIPGLPTENEPTTETPGPSTQSDYKKISNRAVAGFVVLPPGTVPARIEQSLDGTTNVGQILPPVRYVEMGTGYVYSNDVANNEEKKVTDTLISRAREALFADGGKSVAIRYIKEDNRSIATFAGQINEPSGGATVGSLRGSFFPDNIIDMSVSPDKKSFFYVIKTSSGSSGVTVSATGANRKQLFISPLSEWLTGWTNGGQTITTKAASNIPGYVYLVGASGSLTKIAGNINGLTTLVSPNGRQMLYSVGEGSSLRLYVRNLSTGVATELNQSTLPEKCVWGKDNSTVFCAIPETLPSGTYPDDWYQGSVHFNDAFWRIETATGAASQVGDDEGYFIDGIKLALDPDERYLTFINQNDFSLWSLNLKP